MVKIDEIIFKLIRDLWAVNLRGIGKEFIKDNPLLITSSYVFIKVITFFNTRNRHSKAVEIGKHLLQSRRITFHHVEKELFESGWNKFQFYSDKRYSLTDCISFDIIEKERLQLALSFDEHFKQAGYTIVSTL